MTDESFYSNDQNDYAEKPNPVEGAKNLIQKIGIAPIAIVIFLILAVIAFNYLPKPGMLSIKAVPYDETSGISDAVVTIYVDGVKNPFIQDTDSSGIAEFKNVPSGKDLTIEIDAGSEYKIASSTDRLENAEQKDLTIQVSKSIPAAFTQTTYTGAITETCVKPLTLEVQNKGEDAIEVALAGSQDLSSIKTDSQVIGAGQSAQITTQIDTSKTGKKKGSQLKGQIRIKGTDIKADVNLNVAESPKIEIAPTALTCSVGKVCQQIVTIKNTGSTSLDNYQVQLSESITSSVQKQDFDTITSIAPGSETKFGITINAVSEAIGIISINADCYSKKLDVKIN